VNDISIGREVLHSCVLLLHAEDAEEEIDDDCNEFKNIDVEAVRGWEIQIRDCWCEGIGTSELTPLECKEEAVTSKAMRAGIRIRDKCWVPSDEEAHRSFPDVANITGEKVLQDEDSMSAIATNANTTELGPCSYRRWMQSDMLIQFFLEKERKEFAQGDDLASVSNFSKDTG